MIERGSAEVDSESDGGIRARASFNPHGSRPNPPQWQVIEERQNGTAAADVKYQYVWSPAYVDAMVLRDVYSGGVRQAAQRLYAQQDANFDTTALVNTSGQVQERDLYDPYGAVTVLDANWVPRAGNASAFGWQYLHQGGRLDGATGWYLFRNRDYVPSEGRWAERDPIGLNSKDFNIYRYARSEPTNATDPSGLCAAPSKRQLDLERNGNVYCIVGYPIGYAFCTSTCKGIPILGFYSVMPPNVGAWRYTCNEFLQLLAPTDPFGNLPVA